MRRLRLHKESLAPLTAADLRAVAGGVITTKCTTTGTVVTLDVEACFGPLTGHDWTHPCSTDC